MCSGDALSLSLARFNISIVQYFFFLLYVPEIWKYKHANNNICISKAALWRMDEALPQRSIAVSLTRQPATEDFLERENSAKKHFSFLSLSVI